MGLISISLDKLTESINKIDECVRDGQALSLRYSVSSLVQLSDAQGATKNEALKNLSEMIVLLKMLNELMEKTSSVLKETKKNYSGTDFSLADVFKIE